MTATFTLIYFSMTKLTIINAKFAVYFEFFKALEDLS